jgi:hypothetical protein
MNGRLAIIAIISAGLCSDLALAQDPSSKGRAVTRTAAPSGGEIAAAARAGTLDPARATTASLLGKSFRFTPAKLPSTSAKPSEATGFAGVLENGAAGDETGLPPGRYNIFVANVAGQWKGYAESGGRVVREAIRVTEGNLSPGSKPQFVEKGWCVIIWAVWTDGWYVYTTVRKICF